MIPHPKTPEEEIVAIFVVFFLGKPVVRLGVAQICGLFNPVDCFGFGLFEVNSVEKTETKNHLSFTIVQFS